LYTYFLNQDAQRELEQELEYSEVRWGKAHARKYATELKAKLSDIAKNPFIYPERNEILSGIRICNHKGNRIIFTVIEELKHIIVIGFLSAHQDISQLQKRTLQ
jgi:plasmid stabilization system protein ParE